MQPPQRFLGIRELLWSFDVGLRVLSGILSHGLHDLLRNGVDRVFRKRTSSFLLNGLEGSPRCGGLSSGLWVWGLGFRGLGFRGLGFRGLWV